MKIQKTVLLIAIFGLFYTSMTFASGRWGANWSASAEGISPLIWCADISADNLPIADAISKPMGANDMLPVIPDAYKDVFFVGKDEKIYPVRTSDTAAYLLYYSIDVSGDSTEDVEPTVVYDINPVWSQEAVDSTEIWTIGEQYGYPEGADTEAAPLLFTPGDAEKRAELYWSNVNKAIVPTRIIKTPVQSNNRALIAYHPKPNTVADNAPIFQVVSTEWPGIWQHHIRDNVIDSESRINLLPTTSIFNNVEILSTENDAVIHQSGSIYFSTEREGFTLLRYFGNTDGHQDVFEVVKSFDLTSDIVYDSYETAVIGEPVTSNQYQDDACIGGYIHNPISTYVENTLLSQPYDGYNRLTREGPIIPVNKDYDSAGVEDDLLISWYRSSYRNTGVCWPRKRVRYFPEWPADPAKITIASWQGQPVLSEEDIAENRDYENYSIYAQYDIGKTGYNPNEEHALLHPAENEGVTVWALRDDINTKDTSEPYVIVKARNKLNRTWHYKVFKVDATSDVFPDFRRTRVAGSELDFPSPLALLRPSPGSSDFPKCENMLPHKGPYWTDHKSRVYAMAAGLDDGPDSIEVRFYEYWKDESGTEECRPWREFANSGETEEEKAQIVRYEISWPDVDENHTMRTGETWTTGMDRIGVNGQCSVDIVFDQKWSLENNPSNDSSVIVDNPKLVKLIELTRDVSASLPVLPLDLDYNMILGKRRIHTEELPYHLRQRIYIEGSSPPYQLKLEKFVQTYQSGTPLVVPNILTATDRNLLKSVSGDADFNNAVDRLYTKSREQLSYQTALSGAATEWSKALTTPHKAQSGYVTLAFQADPKVCGKNAPITLEIIKVEDDLYTGSVKNIENETPFVEKVTMMHDNLFAVENDQVTYEWMRIPTAGAGIPESYDPHADPSTLSSSGWLPVSTIPSSGQGARLVDIFGAGEQTLKDWWYIMRYKTTDQNNTTVTSKWTYPMLYEGWIKRVTTDINVYDQRLKSFHDSEVNTIGSMIAQAGKRYEGSVALNADPDNINAVGLIELYETVLRRGMFMSIDAGINDPGINDSLLLAAGKIADLYMLLGNEAMGDAIDPTIGMGSTHTEYGPQATQLFAFKNRLPSLLDEELALLRGIDSTFGKNIQEGPTYNKLLWNFTGDAGQVAYVNNYNVPSIENAAETFPQGHGDAWGHYLTSVKTYYRLLRHDIYDWKARAENLLVGGTPVSVDYLDERKFAHAAAARAKTGADIVNLTYMKEYSQDPDKQTAGFKDTDTDRAWGVPGWSKRAGQGAYFDWLTANAILPESSNETGISKIDRTTVEELDEIIAASSEIQSQVDKADKGINPLGLVRDVVPFDIDPGQVAMNKTHFEQIYERALIALNNVKTLFDTANHNSQQLRRQQDSLADFQVNVEESEADFNNRLIEIYGYPYPEDIGPTGAYPDGYNGPDLYHFDYLDVDEFTDEKKPQPGVTYSIPSSNHCKEFGNPTDQCSRDIEFTISMEGFGFIKPDSWTKRKAPGQLQKARKNLLLVTKRFSNAILQHENLIRKIETQVKLFQERKKNQQEQTIILKDQKNTIAEKNEWIRDSKESMLNFRARADFVMDIARASASQSPTIQGFIAGTANGVIYDPGTLARWLAFQAGALAKFEMNNASNRAAIAELEKSNDKENLQAANQFELKRLSNDLANKEAIAGLEELFRIEAASAVELNTMEEEVKQAQGEYASILARGVRILEERARFRARTADDIRDYRYEDMSFRVFRNESLQQYKALFELAARYVYLAAKAYDYETNMLDTQSNSGGEFLESIVKQRTIGVLDYSGTPVAGGTGLANIMARMKANFDILKPQLGFNNPQKLDNSFSLRKELFRINQDYSSNEKWQQKLESFRVDDLWQLPEFKQYVRPFDTPGASEPALVIPFSTTITSGLNFFGWPLGGGDSSYPSSYFSHKIRSVGIWFTNYNTSGLPQSPFVYLIPTGVDVLRTPDGQGMDTRIWRVVDQKLPVPFSLKEPEQPSDWIPINNTLSEIFGDIRKFSEIPAYHDGGFYRESEMNENTRLIGRSVWNSRWLLIIPGATLNYDPMEGLNTFIYGPRTAGGETRTGQGVTDIRILFHSYSYSGG